MPRGSSPPKPQARPLRPMVLLIAITLLAGVVRFGTLALVFPPKLTGDEAYYVGTAKQIAPAASPRWDLT